MNAPEIIMPGQLADELESGRWQKAKGRLAKTKNYRCCLGVACEIAGIPYAGDRAFPPSSITGPMPWLHYPVARALVHTNDHYPGWDRVIERLRALDAELRKEGA